MPRFAANLTLLFTELALPDRFDAARRAGFTGVELLIPYDLPAEELARALRDSGLHMALINTPAPDWAAGDRGRAALPGQEAAFQDDFARALHYASHLSPDHIHIMSGLAHGPDAHQTLLRNLRHATGKAPNQSLTIEPINPHDMPGYFLNDFDQAAAILDALNAPNLSLQFDAYHAHRITGDMPRAWARYGYRARHVQVAAAEGRHEPNSGAIDHPAFFRALDTQGYTGFVSAEYFPAARTQDGLAWLHY
ncbi:hydroxypyruvate isomerase family protein [Thalassovita sp.]|uniref:hydroxypyruvate isomerase family protein n=1 Tax=Thalassovita sp. TaxID=1979401 RepID=UPI0029DE8F5D|nr:TIM barrel protein [Thalassovita sp.]